MVDIAFVLRLNSKQIRLCLDPQQDMKKGGKNLGLYIKNFFLNVYLKMSKHFERFARLTSFHFRE